MTLLYKNYGLTWKICIFTRICYKMAKSAAVPMEHSSKKGEYR